MAPRGLIRSRCVAAAGSLAAFLFAATTTAVAQSNDHAPDFIRVEPDLQGKVQPWDVRAALQKVRSQFRLFGEGDRAWTSLRMVGDNVIWETNSGPGDDLGGPMFNNFSPITQYSTVNGTWFQTFGIPLMMGAPRSEWVRYLVEGVESMRNVKGDPPGFTVMWNGEIFGRPKDFNAADGLVGTLLSGVVSTTDGSCTDHSAALGGATLQGGFQLLPASNCKVTWSPGGWLGSRPITPDGWVAQADSLGPDFSFDDWRVPDYRRNESAFMGNDVATYGHFNDYNSNTLKKFGDVVPGGSGATTRQGWPMGIDFYFDAFSFTLPTVANAKFWRAHLVNNSEKLYGVPHDYDSLYIGFGPWPGRRQDGDNYVDVPNGAWVSAESSDPAGPECAKTDPIPLVGNTCGGFDGGRDNSFHYGGHGIVVLKSPIGDLRNKLFTTPGSPFFGKGNPEIYDDTITFNHGLNWNFGPWGTVWNQGTERARFGIMSSTAENVLDGADCATFESNGGGAGFVWSVFESPEWGSDGSGPHCKFRRYIPGNWTYNTGRPDGQELAPDTLHVPNCGPPGCPVVWADTTWQGWSADRFANLAQFSIGPFRLAAGDTTELFIAMFSGRDSVPFVSTEQGIVDLYLGLFAGPEAPPPVVVRDLDIGAGVAPGQGATVSLVWNDAAENYVDPFMDKFADDMETAPDGTELATIRDANPGIVDRIRARARDNLQQLQIFRSCDGGQTFDANGDCVADPATDGQGNPVGTGWQAYATLTPDASGDAPNTFTDGNVTPGVTYLYSIVGQSKGFQETVVNDPNASVDTIIDTGATPPDTTIVFTCGAQPCETESLVVAPSLLNPLSRSPADPNVVSVYVPASVASGAQAATVTYQSKQSTNFGQTVINRDLGGKATVPFNVQLTSRDIRENPFNASFGNFVEVVEQRDASTGELQKTTVTLQDLARTVVGDTGTVTQVRALRSRTFTRDDDVPVTLNGATQVDETTSGGVTMTTYQIASSLPTSDLTLDPDSRFATTLVLTEVVGSDTLPLMATGNLTGDAATPGGFLSNPQFPGFLISADNSDAGTFNQSFWLDKQGDSLSANLQPTIAYDQSNSANVAVQGKALGEYMFAFSDSTFGPGSPFRLDFTDPAATDAQFDASLAARKVGTTGVTDDEATALVAAALGEDPADVTLAPVKIPFKVENLTYGRTADLAMVDRGEGTKILGVGSDTLTVTVDADQWIPGDRLYVIEDLNVYRTRSVADGFDAIVVNGSGTPQTETRRTLTFSPVNLVCGGGNNTCNPVRGQGGVTAPNGQWIGAQPGDVLHVDLFSPFSTTSRYAFTPSRSITPEEVLTQKRSIKDQMDLIQVVPNPYLYLSAYEASTSQRRLMFTNLPPDGDLRIYSVAGNFVQELDWSPGDLTGNGDLFYDLQTREGNDLAAGLYIYVVTAKDPATGRELKKMGKFVVIR